MFLRETNKNNESRTTRAIRSHSATPLQQRRKHEGQGKQGQGKRSSMIQVK